MAALHERMRWGGIGKGASLALLLGAGCLLFGLCAGDVLLTMGNRDWASTSKVRRDIATWTSWDSLDVGFGSGIQQQILYAVDSPRYPPGSIQEDEHGVRTYWLADRFDAFAILACPDIDSKPTDCGEETFIAQLWTGQGFRGTGDIVTVLKVLILPLSDLSGLAVAEGMLNESDSVLDYVIEGNFEASTFYFRSTNEEFLVADAGGLTYTLPFNHDALTLGTELVAGDPAFRYNITADNPTLSVVLSTIENSTLLLSLAADSDGHPSILIDNAVIPTFGLDGLLAPSVGGSCLLPGDAVLVLLWNTTSDAYELFSLEFAEFLSPFDIPENATITFFASTGLTDRNCGATVSTTAPVMTSGGISTALIFCEGIITVVNLTSRETRVVPGYIHGVVWAEMQGPYNQEGSYKFTEASVTVGTDATVSWVDVRATNSQLFWLTSTNTADQVNALMESDVVTANGNLQTANVLQWMPDVVSDLDGGDNTVHSMSVHCSASNGDFLFYSATVETATGREEAIVAVDVRTVQTSRTFAVFNVVNGVSILQLVYDVEDDCLYGLQEVYSTTDSETRVVEIYSSLVKIPLSMETSATVDTILDLSGWTLVSNDVIIRTVSPHFGLEDVPYAYDPYHHAWMFIDGLYGEVMLLDSRDGSLWAINVDWADADINSRFALSLSYDCEDGILYVLAPLLSSSVFMEVATVSLATSKAGVFYSDQLANEFSFALDCESCFVYVHPGSHSLILRSQFAAVLYPLDATSHDQSSNPTEFTLSVLDSGYWEFLLSSPHVTSPIPLSPYTTAIRLEDFHVSPIVSSSTADVVLLSSSSVVASPDTSAPDSSGSWLFLTVAAACAFVIIVVIVVLVFIAKRTSVFGQPSILEHATPVFDDEIGDKDL